MDLTATGRDCAWLNMPTHLPDHPSVAFEAHQCHFGFDRDERAFLISIPGISHGVVDRLESLGLRSLEALRRAGIEHAINAICAQQGSQAWKNRRRPLARALHQHLGGEQGKCGA